MGENAAGTSSRTWSAQRSHSCVIVRHIFKSSNKKMPATRKKTISTAVQLHCDGAIDFLSILIQVEKVFFCLFDWKKSKKQIGPKCVSMSMQSSAQKFRKTVGFDLGFRWVRGRNSKNSFTFLLKALVTLIYSAGTLPNFFLKLFSWTNIHGQNHLVSLFFFPCLNNFFLLLANPIPFPAFCPLVCNLDTWDSLFHFLPRSTEHR